MSLPATKGFEIGPGFAGTLLRGGEHDEFTHGGRSGADGDEPIEGGILSGISNGEYITLQLRLNRPRRFVKQIR
jgi:chorismate synthase